MKVKLQKSLKDIEDKAMVESYTHAFSSFDSSLDSAWQAQANRMLARVEWDETAETSKNLEEKS